VQVQEMIEENPPTTCPPSFDLIGDACYQLSSATMTWIDAEILGATQSAHLVSFSGPVEQQTVLDFYRNQNKLSADIWTGMNDISQEGVFTCTDGSACSWRNFYNNEPNNYLGIQNCIVMSSSTYLWDDLECHATRLALLRWDENATAISEGKHLLISTYSV
jgi:hypothetical protein